MSRFTDLFHTSPSEALPHNKSIVDDLYDQGWEYEHTQNEPREAAKYYRLAACEGHKPAQTALAMLYLNGKGVPENRALAFQWLVKADQRQLIKLLENY